MYQKLLKLLSLTYKIMFSLLRLRLSLLSLGSDGLRPTYMSLLPRFFSPWQPPLQPFRRTTVTVKTNWNLTLPHKWPRVPSDVSKRIYEKTLHCCRIPLTLRIKCLGVSGSFLNRTVMLLFCCQLCYTNWHSILSCFRKLDVTRYHKCSTFSKTGRAISRLHALVILPLMLFCFARHVSELFLQWDLVLFFDTIMQMTAYLIRFWLLLSLTISCPALRLCCYSLYLSLFRGKPVSFFLLAEKCSSTLETLGFYHEQIHHVLFTWARTLHSTPESLGG